MRTNRRPFLLRRRGRAPRGCAPDQHPFGRPDNRSSFYVRGFLAGIAAGIALGVLLRLA